MCACGRSHFTNLGTALHNCIVSSSISAMQIIGHTRVTRFCEQQAVQISGNAHPIDCRASSLRCRWRLWRCRFLSSSTAVMERGSKYGRCAVPRTQASLSFSSVYRECCAHFGRATESIRFGRRADYTPENQDENNI